MVGVFFFGGGGHKKLISCVVRAKYLYKNKKLYRTLICLNLENVKKKLILCHVYQLKGKMTIVSNFGNKV